MNNSKGRFVATLADILGPPMGGRRSLSQPSQVPQHRGGIPSGEQNKGYRSIPSSLSQDENRFNLSNYGGNSNTGNRGGIPSGEQNRGYRSIPSSLSQDENRFNVPNYGGNSNAGRLPHSYYQNEASCYSQRSQPSLSQESQGYEKMSSSDDQLKYSTGKVTTLQRPPLAPTLTPSQGAYITDRCNSGTLDELSSALAVSNRELEQVKKTQQERFDADKCFQESVMQILSSLRSAVETARLDHDKSQDDVLGRFSSLLTESGQTVRLENADKLENLMDGLNKISRQIQEAQATQMAEMESLQKAITIEIKDRIEAKVQDLVAAQSILAEEFKTLGKNVTTLHVSESHEILSKVKCRGTDNSVLLDSNAKHATRATSLKSDTSAGGANLASTVKSVKSRSVDAPIVPEIKQKPWANKNEARSMKRVASQPKKKNPHYPPDESPPHHVTSPVLRASARPKKKPRFLDDSAPLESTSVTPNKVSNQQKQSGAPSEPKIIAPDRRQRRVPPKAQILPKSNSRNPISPAGRSTVIGLSGCSSQLFRTSNGAKSGKILNGIPADLPNIQGSAKRIRVNGPVPGEVIANQRNDSFASKNYAYEPAGLQSQYFIGASEIISGRSLDLRRQNLKSSQFAFVEDLFDPKFEPGLQITIDSEMSDFDNCIFRDQQSSDKTYQKKKQHTSHRLLELSFCSSSGSNEDDWGFNASSWSKSV